MASQSKSRWGNFLQQAVAGVESRLDTILADDASSATATSTDGNPAEQASRKEIMAMSAGQKTGAVSLSSSTNKNNDRLQERLAKAVVSRRNARSATSSAMPSRTSRPSTSIEIPRISLEGKDAIKAARPNSQGQDADISRDNMVVSRLSDLDDTGQAQNPYSNKSSLELSKSRSAYPSRDLNRSILRDVMNSRCETARKPSSPTQDLMATEQMQSDQEDAEIRHQAEIHQYLETIDALQAKLRYLTKEAADIAKGSLTEAAHGSLEEKVALKDEKIALLMEEGTKLSQSEIKHISTIRKLRAKAVEDEKHLQESKRGVEELERATRLAREKLKNTEVSQREEREKAKGILRLEQDLEKLKFDDDSKTSIILELESQITQMKLKAVSAVEEANRYKGLLESERIQASDLRDELSIARIERELTDDRSRTQIRELQEKIERERERAKVADLELQGEIRVLESRLETSRTRAEEASSGGTGVTQAQLLRQVETLQTQYSVASENWRGIESSLLARISGLEKDCNDLAKKEISIRRKARENGIKSHRLEEQLEQATAMIQGMEDETVGQSGKLQITQAALAKTAAELENVQKEFKFQKDILEAKLASFEAERFNSILHTPEGTCQLVSPVLSSYKQLGARTASSHGRQYPGAFGLGLANASHTPFPERPLSRRQSGHHSQGSTTPHRMDSLQSFSSQSPVMSVAPDTPSIHVGHQDSFLDDLVTPATPDRTVNDVLSISAAAVGPSVQLVERMSAAVRRLESEKAASKDELDRMTAQRDEARGQIVALMREAQAKRSADQKITSLEAEVININQRYQTTLEMLGEKSELVDELQADVADVKQMYRDLVENTMK